MTEQQFSHSEAAKAQAEPAADPWRNEVQDRLAHYKRRRGRRIEGAFTMRFPFPADEAVKTVAAVETTPAVVETPETAREEIRLPEIRIDAPPVEIEPQAVVTDRGSDATNLLDVDNQEVVDLAREAPAVPEPEPEPLVDAVVRPRPKRKVIAFPKHLSVAPQVGNQLADPVTSEVPRILDVPEELEAIPSTPFLDGLQLEPANSAVYVRDHEHVELPFRAVRIPQRVLAGLVDFVLTALGLAVFASTAYKILGKPSLSKPLIIGIAAAAVVLWSLYQYLFVVHAGKTIGMMAARIKLRTFQGKSPTLRQRRNRVLGFYLSALSLGMGLMWAFVDVDTLCWHDRLSKTYLSERE